jgi:glycosyltransferase involved in cell wall biosynthesis
MTSRVVVVCKSWLEISPPVLTIIHALRNLDKSVLCICSGCSPETKEALEGLGAHVEQIYPEDPFPHGRLRKIMHYVAFRRRAWRILRSEDPRVLIWVTRMDTAIALGRRLLQRPYALSIFELHEGSFSFQRAIGLYASRARTVVVPEFCRASILRCRHALDKTPFVLPNRPILRSKERNLPISDPAAAEILSSIPEGCRILLYQGALGRDRNIRPVAMAANRLGEGYRLLIMGEDYAGELRQLRQICPRLVHIPWMRPPDHLQVTSHAHIGIAFYRFDSLNSIFCAPNKIWEYSGYGIPMICQDIPGLRYAVGLAGAGVCVDCEDIEGIANGVRTIEADYQRYSEKARDFYNSVDTDVMVSQIVDDASCGDVSDREPALSAGYGTTAESDHQRRIAT